MIVNHNYADGHVAKRDRILLRGYDAGRLDVSCSSPHGPKVTVQSKKPCKGQVVVRAGGSRTLCTERVLQTCQPVNRRRRPDASTRRSVEALWRRYRYGPFAYLLAFA